MKQPAAKMSLYIPLVTFISIMLIVVLPAIGSGHLPAALLMGVLLAMTGCRVSYRLAPVAYAWEDNRVIVFLPRGRRDFSPVRCCSLITTRLPFTMRLFGGGVLLADPFVFWWHRYGRYCAYITSIWWEDLVLVETDDQQIIISPADARAFVAAWEAAHS